MKRKRKIAPLALVLLLSVYYFCGASLFFALIIAAAAHELGHIAAIYICGGHLKDFSADPCGFSITCAGIPTVKGEISALLAGPFAGLALSLCVCADNAFLKTLGMVSLLLSAYNLLPALPLDGGRTAFIIIQHVFGHETAVKITDASGIVTGTILSATGALFVMPALIIAGIWVLIAQTGIVKSMRVL